MTGLFEGNPLYKVLRDGVSFHGGTYNAWSLPRYNEDIEAFVPGQWTPEIKNVSVCHRGWHLTMYPDHWLDIGCKVYRAEGRGDMDGSGDKIAFSSVRLLEEAPEKVPAWLVDLEKGIQRFHQWNLGETTKGRIAPEQLSLPAPRFMGDREMAHYSIPGLHPMKEPPLFVTVTGPSMSAAIDKARREYFLLHSTSEWLDYHELKVLLHHPSKRRITHTIDNAIYKRLREWRGALTQPSESLLRVIILVRAVGAEKDDSYNREVVSRVNRYIEVLDKGWLPVGRLPGGTIIAVGVDHDE